ncbi:hypothetical protein [Bacillus phage vB_BceS-M2]
MIVTYDHTKVNDRIDARILTDLLQALLRNAGNTHTWMQDGKMMYKVNDKPQDSDMAGIKWEVVQHGA